MRTVSLVGSTGSIGTQAVDVVLAEPDRFSVVAIGAARSVDVLVDQAVALRPERVALADQSRAQDLKERLSAALPAGDRPEVLAGAGALEAISTEADVVVNGVVGFAGLEVTLAALNAGRRLALANKESLIAGGPVAQRARRTPGAEIVPVDSEHGAIHQCLRAVLGAEQLAALPDQPVSSLRRIVLTASGGPFRGRTREQLAEVSVEKALAHPTWKMGPKITVDSSTLMNKGLEVIEAHALFGVGYDRIDVVVHPQSIVHSMIEMLDGTTLAQLSKPDMRLPIGYALAYPDRLETPFGDIDWTKLGSLDFEPPDPANFRCLPIAYHAGREGGTAPAICSGANEVAVDAFLDGRLRWVDIPAVIETTLETVVATDPTDVDDVLAADAEARRAAGDAVAELAGARDAGGGSTAGAQDAGGGSTAKTGARL